MRNAIVRVRLCDVRHDFIGFSAQWNFPSLPVLMGRHHKSTKMETKVVHTSSEPVAESLADLRRALGTRHPGGPNSFIFMQFSAKI